VKPALTFVIQYGILNSVPIWNERPREAKRPWHRARGLALVNSERRHYDANEETSTPIRSSVPD
jgi:hypothetical protein